MHTESRRVAYFDCFSGASGDMLLGALLDAGLSLEDLKTDLAALNIGGYELEALHHVGHGLSGTQLVVRETGGERPVRNLPVVRDLIVASALPDEVKRDSVRVFERIAGAEAHVHGVGVDQVHFHELGAVDTLVDVVGFCSAVRRLGLAALYASALPLGSGTVTTEHGLLPVPAPATLALLADAGAPTLASPGPGELVTPTGAALLTTLAEFAQPAMRVRSVGYGFGTKELPWANALRVWIGDATGDSARTHAHPHTHGMAARAHAHAHDGGHSHVHEHDDQPQPHEHVHEHGHEHHNDHSHAHEHEHEHEHGSDLVHSEKHTP